MPVELQEGKPLLEGEMLPLVAEGESAAPSSKSGGHDLELDAIATSTGTADDIPVKEGEVVVMPLVDGDELLLAEALRAAGALLGVLGGNLGGLLSYTYCVHSCPPYRVVAVGRVPGCVHHPRGLFFLMTPF